MIFLFANKNFIIARFQFFRLLVKFLSANRNVIFLYLSLNIFENCPSWTGNFSNLLSKIIYKSDKCLIKTDICIFTKQVQKITIFQVIYKFLSPFLMELHFLKFYFNFEEIMFFCIIEIFQFCTTCDATSRGALIRRIVYRRGYYNTADRPGGGSFNTAGRRPVFWHFLLFIYRTTRDEENFEICLP